VAVPSRSAGTSSTPTPRERDLASRSAEGLDDTRTWSSQSGTTSASCTASTTRVRATYSAGRLRPSSHGNRKQSAGEVQPNRRRGAIRRVASSGDGGPMRGETRGQWRRVAVDHPWMERARERCVPTTIEGDPLFHRRKQPPTDGRGDPWITEPVGSVGSQGRFSSGRSGEKRWTVIALSVGDVDRRLETVVEGDGDRGGDALEPFLVMTVVTDHHLRTDEPRVTKFVEAAIRRRP
jgi:hypothetical protein